ncbi:hypothetical protein ACQKCH_15240 [Nubsella zeaxanthinifaciens]|uniref:hypothetical protein n=1 Tax=Nubsella zeaxanthinifaciens TaxID=392412 RepID=UPI003D04F37A
MYRKTPSRTTKALLSEISREFATYFSTLGDYIRHICERYPKLIFSVMVCAIVGSGILAFTVMRVSKKEKLPSLSATSVPITKGLSEIVGVGQALKQVLDLQSQINTILRKDTLTSSDSLFVTDALRQLEKINRQLDIK